MSGLADILESIWAESVRESRDLECRTEQAWQRHHSACTACSMMGWTDEENSAGECPDCAPQ